MRMGIRRLLKRRTIIRVLVDGKSGNHRIVSVGGLFKSFSSMLEPMVT